METTRTTQLDSRTGGHVQADPRVQADQVVQADQLVQAGHPEWTAQTLRPIAHWVLMPGAGGHSQLEMVWGVPDPMPSSVAV